MRVLNVILRILAEGFVWSFSGAIMLLGRGALTGVLHGLVFALLFSPRAFELITGAMGGGAFIGLGVGACVGFVVMGLAGIYYTARAEIRFVMPRLNDEFAVCIAGAADAAFFTSFAGASTGTLITLLWSLIPVAAGYFYGAIFGFTCGALGGALWPERVQQLQAQTRALWSARQAPK